METIYQPINFSCSERIEGIKEHFQSYAEMCKLDPDIKQQQLIEEELSGLLGERVTQGELSELQELCSPDKLTVPGELPQKEVHFVNKYTMKLQRQHDITEEAKQLQTVQAKLKYADHGARKKEFDNMTLIHDKNNTKSIEPGSEIILTVRMYSPFDKKLNSRHDRLKCSHEIVALGSQTLADLRDKILCSNDIGFCTEIEGTTIQPTTAEVKTEYPSGLMCIDDVLYNDFRDPNAEDYSAVVQEWAKQKRVGDFPTANMNEVRMHDLCFRLGYPYVYQHRGDCEHIMVFCDARLINNCDSLDPAQYPYYLAMNRYCAQFCHICHVSTAKWMCVDSDRLPHDRTFLCQECHVSYNFIGDKKIGSFRAYPYFDKSLLK